MVYNQPYLYVRVTRYNNLIMSHTSTILISSAEESVDSDSTILYEEGIDLDSVRTGSDSVDLIPVQPQNEEEEEEYNIPRPLTRYARAQLESYDELRANFDSNFTRMADVDEEMDTQRMRFRRALTAHEIIPAERQEYLLYHLTQARNDFVRCLRSDKRAMQDLEEEFFAQRRIAGWEELRIDWTAPGYNIELRLRGAVCPRAPHPVAQRAARARPQAHVHRQRAARLDRDAVARAADRRATGPDATP